MKVRRLALWQWRCFSHYTVDFSDGINVICGCNGTGKTSLLEALDVLAHNTSFRGGTLREWIHNQERTGALQITFERGGFQETIKALYQSAPSQKKFWHNTTPLPTFHPVWASVVWSSSDIDLVYGSPAYRRQWIDHTLSHTDPFYRRALQRMRKIVQHKNHALKQRRTTAELETLNTLLAPASSYISRARQALLTQMQPTVQQFLDQFQLPFRLEMSLDPHPSENFLELLHSKMAIEQRSQQALYGAHREDIVLRCNGKSTKHFLSEGQARLVGATLRLGQWKRLDAEDGAVLLIDEFGMGLDIQRVQQLLTYINTHRQVIITTQNSSHPILDKCQNIVLLG